MVKPIARCSRVANTLTQKSSRPIASHISLRTVVGVGSNVSSPAVSGWNTKADRPNQMPMNRTYPASLQTRNRCFRGRSDLASSGSAPSRTGGAVCTSCVATASFSHPLGAAEPPAPPPRVA
jgi:hypothetical protein